MPILAAMLLHNGAAAPDDTLPDLLSIERGVFETIRVRRRGNKLFIAALPLHLERLENGNRTVSKHPRLNADSIIDSLYPMLSAFPWGETTDAVARIITSPTDIYLSLTPWKPRFLSSIALVSYHGSRPNPECKECEALVSRTARNYAESLGADEALLRSESGEIFEGAWSNFFWLDRGGSLVTARERILPGITRNIILSLASKLVAISERSSTISELFEKGIECFITQATHGIVPVRTVDGHMFETGEITRLLMNAYEAELFANGFQMKIHGID